MRDYKEPHTSKGGRRRLGQPSFVSKRRLTQKNLPPYYMSARINFVRDLSWKDFPIERIRLTRVDGNIEPVGLPSVVSITSVNAEKHFCR